jgi:hypothetical protein
MNENIKVRWLTDHEQTKIAPKTLASQVYNEDGTLFKDKVEQLIQDVKTNIPEQINSDWNQEDETAVDYIKNRPFYGGNGEMEWVDFIDNATVNPPTFFKFSTINSCLDLIVGETYKIIINGEEYIDTAEFRQHAIDGDSIFIGTEISESIASTTFSPKEGELPFFIAIMNGTGVCFFVDPIPTSITILQQKPKIKLLDRKYISYIPGEKTEGNTIIYEDKEYFCGVGAEIFNDSTNKAIGSYSHAEGHATVSIGDGAHAEGS